MVSIPRLSPLPFLFAGRCAQLSIGCQFCHRRAEMAADPSAKIVKVGELGIDTLRHDLTLVAFYQLQLFWIVVPRNRARIEVEHDWFAGSHAALDLFDCSRRGNPCRGSELYLEHADEQIGFVDELFVNDGLRTLAHGWYSIQFPAHVTAIDTLVSMG